MYNSIMKKFGKLKITNTIAFIEGLFSIVAISVSIVFYLANVNKVEQGQVNRMATNVDSFSDTVNNIFTKYQEVSSMISQDDSAMLLQGYYFDIIGDQYGKISALNKMSYLLTNYNLVNDITSLTAMKFKESEKYSYNILHSSSIDAYTMENIDYVLNNYTFYNNDGYKIINYKNGSYLVFTNGESELIKIAVELSPENIGRLFSLAGAHEFSTIKYSFNHENKLVFYAGNIENYEYEKETDILKDEFEVAKGKIISKSVVFEGMNLIAVVDYSKLPYNGLITLDVMIIGIILIVCFGFLTIFITQLLISKPISELKRALKEIGKGNFDYKITRINNTDMQILNDGFNNMASSLKNYIDDNYLQQLRIKEADYRALQSQINPHFLYNCFANISALCKLGDTKQAERLTNSLSMYYNYITRNKDLFTRLDDEYKHMIKYLDIQKIRFGDRVTYIIDPLLDKYKDLKVPKIIFQPVVENSFKYAFGSKTKDAILKITIKARPKYLEIAFRDDGDSVTKEMVDEINKKISTMNVETSGLINAAKRIISYSEKRSSVKCSISKDYGGMKVSMKLDWESLKNEN